MKFKRTSTSTTKGLLDAALFCYSIRMTLGRAYELVQTQVYIGRGYNRNATGLIPAEVQRKQGQAATNQLITDLKMQKVFGFTIGQPLNAT